MADSKSKPKDDDKQTTSSNPARAAGTSKPTEAEVLQAKLDRGDLEYGDLTAEQRQLVKTDDTRHGDSSQPGKVNLDDEEAVVGWLLEAGLSTDERTRRIHEVEGHETNRDPADRRENPRTRIGDALNAARSQPGMGYDSAEEQP
jgi:hypothetical protein